MKRKRSAYRGNSDGIPTEKASSSEFPRNFVKSPNGSPTAIIFPRNSSVFSEEQCVPRNFLGIFRRTEVSSEFRRYIPKKFRGTPILCFLGISSEIPRYIPRISFSVEMSVRIPLFSCSVYLKNILSDHIQLENHSQIILIVTHDIAQIIYNGFDPFL
ncbi:hypothetical protein YC2023_039520 [Brassica napus]